MAKKKLLTLEDLYAFYSTHKRSSHFSSEDSGIPITVQTKGVLKFSNKSQEDDPTEGLTPVTLMANHTGENINGSSIDNEVATNALPSFANRPILGYIHTVDGQPEFYGHNMHEDEDGNIVYDEVPVGIIKESCNARLEYDDTNKKTYVVVDGFLFDEYSRATEILEREQECSVSVELSIRELSFNAKTKVLVIENYYYSGVTILGKTEKGEEVKPGMVGSNIKLSDFSAKNNSIFTEEKVIDLLERINLSLSTISNIQSLKEGGKLVTKFEELLEKYNVTAEDIDFEYENMTDEELEAKFAEVFTEDETQDDDPASGDGENVDEGDSTEIQTIEEEVEVVEVETEEVEASFENKPVQITREKNGLSVSFELSHDDIRWALYNLIGQYDELDNTWYYIRSVYDDHFVMEDWDGSKIFGQKYSKDGDNVSLEGERWELFSELLTASEKASLDEMRSNYSIISEKLQRYEDAEVKEQKENLLNDESYSLVKESAEFVNLVEKVNEYSIDEIRSKADSILLSYYKSNSQFSATQQKTPRIVTIPFNNEDEKNKSPYGGLFD